MNLGKYDHNWVSVFVKTKCEPWGHLIEKTLQLILVMGRREERKCLSLLGALKEGRGLRICQNMCSVIEEWPLSTR